MKRARYATLAELWLEPTERMHALSLAERRSELDMLPECMRATEPHIERSRDGRTYRYHGRPTR